MKGLIPEVEDVTGKEVKEQKIGRKARSSRILTKKDASKNGNIAKQDYRR